MLTRARPAVGLVALLFLVDQLFRLLHPEVNLVRAGLVGVTAFAALFACQRGGLGRRPRAGAWLAPAGRGGLAVFASAFLSVLLIQGGWLVSRSALSVGVHVALVVAAYSWLERLPRLREARTA